MIDPKLRFSNRVENYAKYRPSYPSEVVDILREECQLTAVSVIADIGSGTGLLADLFLKNGNRVYGVEPNRKMREASERLLKAYSNFVAVEGAAESTTLGAHSIDFITAGQAFHWFDRQKAREEFIRIQKTGGWVVLIWNDRLTDSSPFLGAYEELMNTYAIDYHEVDHRQMYKDAILEFFGTGNFNLKILKNSQAFNLESLKGRVLSSSYAPEEGHPNFQPMMDLLISIFQRYQRDGQVVFEYNTRVYYGKLRPNSS